MSTTNPQSDLHQALQRWHAALARNDLEAQITARLLVDILVAGGLDERIEEITRPASAEHGPVLPLLRHAHRLTRELGHLAGCQLATARALDRSLAGRGAPATPAPEARRRRIVRLDLTSLIVLLATAVYAGLLIADLTRRDPPPFPYGLPLPSAPPPALPKPHADRSTTALAPPAPTAPRMPNAS